MPRSLPALVLSFTEEHLQGHGSHTLRALLVPFTGTEKSHLLIHGCLWKTRQYGLGEAYIHSGIFFPPIMKIENNWLSLQLLHFPIFGKTHQDRNNTSTKNRLQYTLGDSLFESREINLMARHELQD